MACVGALTGLGFWGMENSSEIMLLMLLIHLMLLMTGVGTSTEEGFKRPSSFLLLVGDVTPAWGVVLTSASLVSASLAAVSATVLLTWLV